MRTAYSLPCLYAAILTVAVFANDAAAIVRCEARDGKVTYANEECPPNTRLVRKVEESPPIVVHDGKRAATEGEPRSASRIEPTKSQARINPIQEDQKLTAQIEAQRRECESRSRQLEHLQADLAAASPANRSSAELAMRRAQDEYLSLCPKSR